MAQWLNINGEIEINFNKDFLPVPMTAQQLDSLMKAWQLGGIPQEELFHALKRGEVIRNSTTYDEYIDGLETDDNDMMSGVSPPEDDDEPEDSVGVLSQIRQRLGL
jgi:hypothetical protein